ncbi:MAG: hypothetical protein ACFE95_15215 [Candidatus Hodarchaeota archaeon]
MVHNLTLYLNKFTEYYKESLLRRFFIGIVMGGLLWGILLVFSILARPFFNNNIFFQTFLKDLPGIGLILGLLITLEIWGLIPHPVLISEEEVSPEGSVGNTEMRNELKVEEKT